MSQLEFTDKNIDFVASGVSDYLERMLTQNMIDEKDVRSVIYKTQRTVREAVANALKASMSARSGKLYTRTKSAHVHLRHIEKVIKIAIYKRILGANVSLYSSKRSSGKSYEYPIQGRYNPRRQRSSRTKQLENADLDDEIARWINGGTQDRKTGGRYSYYNGERRRFSPNGAYFDRRAGRHVVFDEDAASRGWSTGKIGGDNFFSVAPAAQEKAAEDLARKFEDIFNDISKDLS